MSTIANHSHDHSSRNSREFSRGIAWIRNQAQRANIPLDVDGLARGAAEVDTLMNAADVVQMQTWLAERTRAEFYDHRLRWLEFQCHTVEFAVLIEAARAKGLEVRPVASFLDIPEMAAQIQPHHESLWCVTTPIGFFTSEEIKAVPLASTEAEGWMMAALLIGGSEYGLPHVQDRRHVPASADIQTSQERATCTPN